MSASNNMRGRFFIPESEYTVEFSRSAGPGGQNVNKTASKAQLRFAIGQSRVLTEIEKERIRDKLKNRITNADELILSSEEERSQAQNKQRVIVRFHDLIRAALVVPKKRRPTRPPRRAKEKRLAGKRHVADRKQSRRQVMPTSD